nr:unnamed protein product [Digitaria exilis]
MTTTRVVLRRFNKVGPLATATELCDAAAELLATAIFVFAAEGTTLAGRLAHRGVRGGDGLRHRVRLLRHGHGRPPDEGRGLAVGLLAGANVLACGAFDGAVLNPACPFGPAIMGSRRLANHWVYWVGPMLGTSLSSVLCDLCSTPASPTSSATASSTASSFDSSTLCLSIKTTNCMQRG